MKKILSFLLVVLMLPLGFVLTGCKTANFELKLDTTNVKTEFVYGEEFSAEGLVALRVEGEEELDVTDYVTVNSSAYQKDQVGIYTIKVSYKGLTKTYNVEVKELKVLTIDVSGAKTMFNKGEDFSSSGLVVNYTLNNNTEPVTSYTIDSSEYNKNQEGVYTIEISYLGVVETYNVEVIDVKAFVQEAFESEHKLVAIKQGTVGEYEDANSTVVVDDGSALKVYIQQNNESYNCQEWIVQGQTYKVIRQETGQDTQYLNYIGADNIYQSYTIDETLSAINFQCNIDDALDFAISKVGHEYYITYQVVSEDSEHGVTYTMDVSLVIEIETKAITAYTVAVAMNGQDASNVAFYSELNSVTIPEIPTDVDWVDRTWGE